jgi:hypothetical protein
LVRYFVIAEEIYISPWIGFSVEAGNLATSRRDNIRVAAQCQGRLSQNILSKHSERMGLGSLSPQDGILLTGDGRLRSAREVCLTRQAVRLVFLDTFLRLREDPVLPAGYGTQDRIASEESTLPSMPGKARETGGES